MTSEITGGPMAQVRRTAATWGAAILTALPLTGCTGDHPAPPPTPTPVTEPASPAPTPTAVVEPPARPAAIDDDGPAGAEAAATYFMMYEPFMQATGETAPWQMMSQGSCEFCAARLKNAQVVADNGYTFVGGIDAVTIIHTYSQDAATGTWPIDIDVARKPTTVTTADGDSVLTEDGGTDHLRIEAVHTSDGWRVQTVALRPTS